VTQQVTTISPLFSTPYITVTEYKQAPTGTDVDDLVGGGTTAINDVELANEIARASSWIDAHCNQVLAATMDTDNFRARISRDGFLKVHPRFSPIVEVVSASVGVFPNALTTLDPTTAWIEPQTVMFPITGQAGFFTSAIQFSPPYTTNREVMVSMTYVNGYANTLLASSASVSASSVSVSDLTGFVPNQQFQVYDGAYNEILKVASTFTPARGAGSLPLVSPTAYAHAAGVSVSALPPAIKLAAIYMTNVLLKSRGNASVVMSGLSFTPTEILSKNPTVMSDYTAAINILEPYRRIR
jgi:hypothetical protein